jgi:hypothetical protein
MVMLHFALAVLALPPAHDDSTNLPDYSMATVPLFAHCGPNNKTRFGTNFEGLYKKLSRFSMVTLEKFTFENEDHIAPPNKHEEAKILAAAAGIKKYNPRTKVMFYLMAWQNFVQYDLHDETLQHIDDHWLVSYDNGTVPGLQHGWSAFNHSNPDMRKAWVSTLQQAFATGFIDGVFIDITPQALADQPDANYSTNINRLCPFPQCSKRRQADLLDGLRLLFADLRAALPEALVICNPIDAVQYPACNVAFFECFGCQTNSHWSPTGSVQHLADLALALTPSLLVHRGDHGRDVTEDMRLLASKWRDDRHLVQARAPGAHNKTLGIHLAEFLLGVRYAPAYCVYFFLLTFADALSLYVFLSHAPLVYLQ